MVSVVLGWCSDGAGVSNRGGVENSLPIVTPWIILLVFLQFSVTSAFGPTFQPRNMLWFDLLTATLARFLAQSFGFTLLLTITPHDSHFRDVA